MKYSPSLRSHQTLENLFVGEDRRRILEDIVKRGRAALGSGERNHSLLVGRRGAGKSHIVALAYHRIGELTENGNRLQRSWLSEDPFGIDSYKELLRQVGQGLLHDQSRQDQTFQGMSINGLEAWLDQQASDNGPIVVFVENLDQVLETIENEGQQLLRHFLQTSPALLFVATTTTMSRDLSSQASPFYGFFTTTALDPFDVKTAAEMIQALAVDNGDTEVADFVKSDIGKARLEAIEHLAGGQPRMWATLGESLTISGLNQLVQTLITQLDDLTPYYQEQLGRLSPLQRRIIGCFARFDRPLTVDMVASELETSSQSVSKQIHTLYKTKRWLEPSDSKLNALLDRRRTYYELSEPLSGVIFQLKESRGEPLRIVVDFIKLWFEADRLGGASAATNELSLPYMKLAQANDASAEVSLLLRGLSVSTGVPRLKVLYEVDSALGSLLEGDPEPLFNQPTAIRRAIEAHVGEEITDPKSILDTRAYVHYLARIEFGDVPNAGMDRWLAAAEAMLVQDQSFVWLVANWFASRWTFDDAEASLKDTVRILGADHPETLASLNNLASAYHQAGRVGEAIVLHEQVLADRERILGVAHPDTLTGRSNLVVSYHSAGRVEEAIVLQEQVLADRERILGEDHPETLASRSNLASCYNASGRVGEAIALHEQVVADRERTLGLEHPETLASRNNLAFSYQSAGRVGEAIVLHEEVLADRERILGVAHPDTVIGRSNLAVSYHSAGRVEEAIVLQEQVLAELERILGVDHPDTLMSSNNLATSYQLLGRVEEASTLHGQVLAELERIQGVDHPNTIISRNNLAVTLAVQEAGA